jgi:hypothetical protein
MSRSSVVLSALCLAVAAASSGQAQAWAYPAFQPPRVTSREFNFGVADAGNAGTTILFQWREQVGAPNQLSLDAGLADPNTAHSDAMVFVGGQYARQLTRSSADMPLDFLFTFGAYLAAGDYRLFRMPVGVSVGHRFDLTGGMALTPYVHPRVSVDVRSGRGDNSDLNVDFDLGASFEITRTLAIRASALFTGSEGWDDGFGISLAWTASGLSRSRR